MQTSLSLQSHIRTATTTLVLAMLMLAACGEAKQGNERAGDGSQAYLKIAGALCSRLFACAEERKVGPQAASEALCAEGVVTRLARSETVSCKAKDDIAIEAGALGACLDQLETLDCATIQYEGTIERALYGELEGCSDALTQLARVEDERSGAKAIGERCGMHDRCEFGAECVGGERSCGVCRALPKVGEKCRVSEEGDPYCGLGSYCIGGTCRASLSAEGGPCTDWGECTIGLDCVDGRCLARFEYGDPCDSTALNQRCGNWLECDGDMCKRPDDLGRLGAACDPELARCVGGFCLGGKCTARRGLSESCRDESECVQPYACVSGKCVEVPACKEGERDDVCTTSDQCKDGLGCLHGGEEPSRCTPSRGDVGEPCLDQGECRQSRCVKGICKRVALGGSCESTDECEDGLCTDGTCAAPMCE